EGEYPFSVFVSDRGGASAAVQSTAGVADAPLSVTGASPLSGTAGVPFTAAVAEFVPDPGHTTGDYKATIDGGAGATSPGTIVDLLDGRFQVQGTTTYTAGATDPVAVTVVDAGGSQATVQTSATVADGPPASLTASGTTIHAAAKEAFTAAVT